LDNIIYPIHTFGVSSAPRKMKMKYMKIL